MTKHYTDLNINSPYFLQRRNLLSSLNKNYLSDDILLLFGYLEVKLIDLMSINDIISYVAAKKHMEPLAFIIAILFFGLRKGNLYFNLDSKKTLLRMPEKLRHLAYKLLKMFLKYFEFGYYQNIIDQEQGRLFKPIIVDVCKKSRDRLIYFQKYYFYNNNVKKQIIAFSNLPTNISTISKHSVEILIEKIYSPSLVIRDKYDKSIKKDILQIRAIRETIFSNLFIISGGPGTGKTSLLTNIIRLLLRIGIDVSEIFLGAPTGRAASRMTEAIHSSIMTIKQPMPIDLEVTKLHGSTLHKILGYDYKSGFIYGKYYKLPASVFIIDEVSMIDLSLMNHILEALEISSTKLILIGDKDQLPSVEAGSVFADILSKSKNKNNYKINSVILNTMYRSTANIIKLAKKINAGEHISIVPIEFKNALHVSEGEWSFVLFDEKKIKSYISTWVKHHYLSNSIVNFFDLVQKFKKTTGSSTSINKHIHQADDLLDKLFERAQQTIILTFVKDGITGSRSVNNQIADYIKKTINHNDYSNTENKIFDGAIIMITQNDYSRSLFNGDIGIVISNQFDEEYYAYFQRKGQYYIFPIVSLINWNLAFATTIHKSQGSEFKNVMILLPNNNSCKLLTKEALYTAVTRASNNIIICGCKALFNYAVFNTTDRQIGTVL